MKIYKTPESIVKTIEENLSVEQHCGDAEEIQPVQTRLFQPVHEFSNISLQFTLSHEVQWNYFNPVHVLRLRFSGIKLAVLDNPELPNIFL
ncbi:hypothetical protein V6N12_014273 [Hibiscus sabdariffa]|uniref:Uncharacterized protein n=1 Tax=Hibiscus sabdariffa TaxID=183260 RepID=A0ABR2DJP9_9ROSI